MYEKRNKHPLGPKKNQTIEINMENTRNGDSSRAIGISKRSEYLHLFYRIIFSALH